MFTCNSNKTMIRHLSNIWSIVVLLVLCANQPAHPLSLTNVFVIPCFYSTIDRLAAYNFSRFWLVSVAEYEHGCVAVIKLFSYSTQLSMKFILLIHLLTGYILKPPKKMYIFQHFSFYGYLKFHGQKYFL